MTCGNGEAVHQGIVRIFKGIDITLTISIDDTPCVFVDLEARDAKIAIIDGPSWCPAMGVQRDCEAMQKVLISKTIFPYVFYQKREGDRCVFILNAPGSVRIKVSVEGVHV